MMEFEITYKRYDRETGISIETTTEQFSGWEEIPVWITSFEDTGSDVYFRVIGISLKE